MNEAKATEHFDFGSSAPDLLVSSRARNLRNEVTNKGFDPEAVIDAFERAKGIKKRPKSAEMAEYSFKNVILDPEQQRDQDMLNELMNNKKYMITLWKDTWTTQGNFRVFVIYGVKKEKEAEPKDTHAHA
jgi:disulfide oxidoreductase YuzD